MKGRPTAHEPLRKGAVDWAALRRRLETTRATLECGAAPGAEGRKEILRARARELAREAPSQPAAHEFLEVVAFQLADETYALESSYVREIYPLKEFTPLPGLPPFFLGLMNARGQLLAVIDIKKLFDLPAKGLTDLNQVIILHHEGLELGILADAVLGLRSVPLAEVQSSLPTLTGIRADYLRGVAKERFVILNAERILLDKNIVVQSQSQA